MDVLTFSQILFNFTISAVFLILGIWLIMITVSVARVIRTIQQKLDKAEARWERFEDKIKTGFDRVFTIATLFTGRRKKKASE